MDVNFLENKFYDVIVAEMQSFLDANGFKAESDMFVNATKALKIEYNAEKSLYNLLLADVAEGNIGDFAVVSSYLFDSTHGKKDAVSVGIDFVDSARKALGAKAVRKSVGETELPSAQGASGAVTVAVLTAKLLATYPELKEVYKTETAEKGKFLYLDFYTTYFVPEIRNSLENGTKKNVKKLIDLFCEVFVTGDKATSTLVVAVLAAAIGKDQARFAAATEKMENCPHLVSAVNNEIAVLVKDKKFQKAMKFKA